MNSDAFFTIGKTHKVCQDYALAGRSKSGKAFAIVSDGCSASQHTDVGARLLVWAAREWIDTGREPDIKAIVLRADMHAVILGLPQTCLDATLAIVYETASGVNLRIWGDGIVISKSLDGQTTASWVEYDSGAPFYPSYYLAPERLSQYRKTYGTGKRYVYSHSLRGTGKIETSVEEWLAYDFHYDKGGLVLIGTDGVSAFGKTKITVTSKTIEPVGVINVVERLAAIKSFGGEFVSRRCKRFFSKQCPALGWEPQDDVAVGGIYLGGSK